MNFFSQLFKSAISLLYPPLCLHCQESLHDEEPLFCSQCLKELVPINPNERCPYCFTYDFDREQERCCHRCSRSPLLLERVAAVFNYQGPAATLVKHLKYGGRPDLAEGMGAYLAAQFLQLGWPMPDGIVPMPMAGLRRIDRGYNQSLLLAQVMGSIIACPIYDVLRRKSGDFSQAGLNYKQRLNLNSQTFFLTKRANDLEGSCLLLIDDVMTTGSSLRCCAETLFEAFPKSIYALTVCRAI